MTSNSGEQATAAAQPRWKAGTRRTFEFANDFVHSAAVEFPITGEIRRFTAQHPVTLLDQAHLRTGRGFAVVGLLPSETPLQPSLAELGST